MVMRLIIMIKPTHLHLIAFIFCKYLLYYLVLAALSYDSESFSSRHGVSILYTLAIFLPLPIVNTLLFLFPVYYSFKVSWYFSFLILLGWILGEYYIFTRCTSHNWMDSYGILNGCISIGSFVLAFYKSFPGRVMNANKNDEQNQAGIM